VLGILTVNALRWSAVIWLVVSLGLPIVRNAPAGHWASDDIYTAGVSSGSLMVERGESTASLEPVGPATESHLADRLAHMTCCTISAFSLDDGTGAALGSLTLREAHLRIDVLPLSRAIAPDPQPPRFA
jgi:hypothetical protein